MPLASGARLGPYEIRGAVGAGGMGEVYRAHDPRLGRDVALKLLPDSMAGDPEGLARFTREARAVAALNHPHIVTIFSTEEIDGVRFMTMELIEGRTLDRVIPESGLSLSQFFDVSMALADALSTAHQKQITHRDLKPANVMVTDAGRVKVLDFGLARGGEAASSGASSFEEEATRQKLTQAGTILGTMPYMSPEQIEAKPLDGRSDIFSLGIVMYEMATGGRPFRGDSSPALMSSIMREHPKPAAELRPDLPSDVSRLVGKCLEKHPRDRMQTAQEILLELKALRRAWESGSAAARPHPAPAARPLVARSSNFRIAVLPFVSRSPGGDAEALADGLTDDITAGLARFPYLRVVSRPDAERLKGQAADARAGATLGARYLLDGTVRTSGGSVRVSVRLVDAETGAHMWADTFDRSLGSAGVFELQDDLTSRVVATVGDSYGVLVRSMATTLKERPTEELSADELVLRYYAYTQTFRPEEHLRLRAAFERALVDEPSHAPAWACLSILYEQEFAIGVNPLPDALARTRQAAERSIESDASCQTGWRCIAAAHFFDRDLTGLRMATERAMQINPLNTGIVAFVAGLLAFAGDWDIGVPIVRRCMDLNPQHPGWFHYGVVLDHYRRGELEDALTHAKRSNMPLYVQTPLFIAATAGRLGRAADARAAFDGIRKNHPGCLDADQARAVWGFWIWEGELVDQLMDGYARARALIASEPNVSVGPLKANSGSSTVAASGSAATKTPASGRSTSIAVLPFTDMSAAKDQDWFCDGIAEEILNALSQLKGLSVAARASAFSFRGKGDDLAAIGEKLHVATVLDGSVRRSGDQLRITVRLCNVENGYQLWSDRYDRDMKDVFDVQDEIAGAIAERLRLTLKDDSASLPKVIRHTENQEAYHLYLRGRHHWYSRNRGGLQKALQYFDDATKVDPEYPLPWVGLADLYTVQAIYAFEREADLRPKARAAVERALVLNDQLGDVHRTLGFTRLFFDCDPSAATRCFERSIELDPSNALAHAWLAWASTWPGGETAAIAAINRALDLDPLNIYIISIGAAILDFWGRSEQAVAAGQKALEIDPHYLPGLYVMGGLYSRLGRHEEAIAAFSHAAEVSGRAPFYLSYHAWAHARAGTADVARKELRELESRSQTEYVAPLFRAAVHAALGELDRAFRLLEEAVQCRNAWMASPRLPLFDGFRKDPRFAEQLRRIGHPDVADGL